MHTQETQMIIAHTIKNSEGKHQTIADITLGTSSTNDAYQRAIFRVSPIHPRVMVGHSCWCLHSP
jgi:hypothetical protein